jgi:hypothetical protein
VSEPVSTPLDSINLALLVILAGGWGKFELFLEKHRFDELTVLAAK